MSISTIRPGKPYPLGATIAADGVNFSLASRHATCVVLEFYDSAEANEPTQVIRLEEAMHRTGDIWHVLVCGVGPGQLYGYRVEGPYSPHAGHRFNPQKLLLDPYARAVAGRYETGHIALFEAHAGNKTSSTKEPNALNSAGHTVRSVVISDQFDWQDVRCPQVPLEDTIIYEVHVRGLTMHPSSPAVSRGTYLGVIDCIPHFKALGITSVELLPVHEFDGGEDAGVDPRTGRKLSNFWGYSTLGFFAPEERYAGSADPQGIVDEFKTMVRELHRAGIEVILDVVYNHTGEGSEAGPTLSYRGLDNQTYYLLDGEGHYQNYSGCGNTLNCNAPITRQLILDSLRYWAVEMQIDGFRFDLATILGRDINGQWVHAGRSLLQDISDDPVLRHRKLISESWDAAGLYKVGEFPAPWMEWNGRYRDDIRRFLQGELGLVPAIAWRLGGSPDLFGWKGNAATSINFITCHDGFTLRDLCSYEQKHNEANGEQNRDGTNDNHSLNHGVEGETEDPRVLRQRIRYAKNAIALLCVSRGTPMLLGGDEQWRTKQGNNNTYNQDSALTWLDWSDSDEREEILKYCRGTIALRRHLPVLRRTLFASPISDEWNDLEWHGIHLESPDLSYHSQSLAFHARGSKDKGAEERDVYVAINMWKETLSFELPMRVDWLQALNTAAIPPNDSLTIETALPVNGKSITVDARSIVMLVERISTAGSEHADSSPGATE